MKESKAKKTTEGYFKENTVEITFNGKKYRVSQDVKEAIEKREKASSKASSKAKK